MRGIEEDRKLLQVVSRDKPFDFGSFLADIDHVEARVSSRGFLVEGLPQLSISRATRTASADKHTEQALLSKTTETHRFTGKGRELWQCDDFACSQSANTFEGVLLAVGLNRIRLGINVPPPVNC